MPHDVFISYSSKDKNAADAVCAVLERNGIRCWVAPRDVLPGIVWGTAIIGAIQGAKLMVLVFSGAANTSPQIEREVERAISRGLPVVPFRIEDIQPSDSLEYFISASHWLDAFTQPLEQHLETLARVVRQLMEMKQGKPAPEANGHTASRPSIAETPAVAPVAVADAAPPIPTIPAPSQSPAASSARPPRSRWLLPIAATGVLVICAAIAALLVWPRQPTAIAKPVGEVFRDCADCPEMVVVPPGRFTMGAAQQEKSIFDWEQPFERPAREVRIARPFAAGVYPVTRDEFEDFVRQTKFPVDGGCTYWNGKDIVDPTRSFRDPKFPGGPQAGDHPVVCIAPQDAAKFVAWLSAKTGHTYRVLSDAEREYVSRAGTTTAFWWGPSISADQANYWSDAVYKNNPTAPSRGTTVPVKFFRPNPWGLYQVHGNIQELVADCWHPNLEGAPTDGSAWQADAGSECKGGTARNGAFMNNADWLRSARRGGPVASRQNVIGFRVARSLD